MTRRGLWSLAVLCVAMVSLAAVAMGAPVRIVVARTWESPFQERLDEFDKAFMRKHPGIIVERIPHVDGSKYATAFAAGVAPDVFVGVGRSQIEQNMVEDLTPYLQRDRAFGYFEDYSPFAQEPWVIDDRVYGVAYDVGAVALFYRGDLFDQAGIGRPSFQWTNEDMRGAAKKLTRRQADGKVEFWGVGGTWIWWLNAPMLAGYGARLYDPSNRAVLEPVSQAVEALAWWSDLMLRDEAALPDGWDITTGQTAMSFQGTWGFDYWMNQLDLFEGTLEIAPVPAGPAGRFTTLAGNAWAISSQSKAKDAAWTYISELLSAQTMRDIEPFGAGSSPRRSLLSTVGRHWGRKGVDLRAILGDALDRSGLYTISALEPQVFNTVWPYLNKVISGELDPRSAVTLAREQGHAVLKSLSK